MVFSSLGFYFKISEFNYVATGSTLHLSDVRISFLSCFMGRILTSFSLFTLKVHEANVNSKMSVNTGD